MPMANAGSRRGRALDRGGRGTTLPVAMSPARSTQGAARAAPATARGHQRTRADHAREIAEDYAETIADLIDADGQARVTTIARRLGVSHVTVIRTLNRLSRAGFASVAPYQPVTLTPAGERLAAQSRRRHTVVLAFLRALGVSEEAAAVDAEGIEHHLSEETLAALERFALSKRRPARRARGA